MGKQGPCRHCGVTSTPLWRNGPPDKPVLCNACGSRWRTKDSLANYTPLHVREAIESEDIQPVKSRCLAVSITKTAQFKPQNEAFKVPKKKPNSKPRSLVESSDSFSDQNFKRASEATDWNSNTRSSSYSGSGASYSESCAHYDGSEFTGSSQSNMWEPLVPSKKRAMGIPCPKPTRVEQLTKDLYTILHETPQSVLSAASEEDLVYPAEILNPMDSTDSIEIGSGSILILNSNPKSQSKLKSKLVEEESEASSVPTDVNIIGRSYVTACNGSSGAYNREVKSEAVHFSCMSPDEKGNRSALLYPEVKPKPRDLLQNGKQCSHCVACASSSASLDLKEILNYECFSKFLTHDEQQRLHKYLSCADSLQASSLRSLFSSTQFIETINRFNKLVREELFNPSLLGIDLEEWKSLRTLVLNNSVKSELVHSYEHIMEKDKKNVRTPGKLLAGGTGSSMTYLKSPRNIIDYDSSECSDDFSNEDLLLDIPCNSSFPEAELLTIVPNEESQSGCKISRYKNKQPMLKA